MLNVSFVVLLLIITARLLLFWCLVVSKRVKRETFNLRLYSHVLMRRSIRKFDIPPGATPRAFELLKIGLFNFPPLGAKKRFKCPTNSTELPLLKVKFRLQSNTLYAFQREICRNDTFKLLLKTLLKELFTTKGEILPCKSVKPCKN